MSKNLLRKDEFLEYSFVKTQAPFQSHVIAFDPIQVRSIYSPLPLILIGSAGSGKTSLALEKLKTLSGDLLYVTLSPYLVHNARHLYYARHEENEHQTVDFLSFEEFLGTIQVPSGQEITASAFLKWFECQAKPSILKDGRKLYEEFRGVIIGGHSKVPYLSQDDYIKLGIKQSIYAPEEREGVYQLFQKYLLFLKEASYFDTSLLAYKYLEKVSPCYDAIIVDEIQDITNSQLTLILKALKKSDQFLLCGDANQIIHPNFFSWANLKSYFYQDDQSAHTTQILTRSYRNTPEVTELANRILKIKNARFGSIDKESHYLIESNSSQKGQVACIPSSVQQLKSLNEKVRRSVDYAILVLNDDQKKVAKQYFETPLIFSVQEAKGLEYKNVILFHFIGEEARYQTMVKGLDKNIFAKEFVYGRAKDKADKSLEAYKFYINALYVAITRAIQSVYLKLFIIFPHFCGLQSYTPYSRIYVFSVSTKV